jgi:hypothetical protein
VCGLEANQAADTEVRDLITLHSHVDPAPRRLEEASNVERVPEIIVTTATIMLLRVH